MEDYVIATNPDLRNEAFYIENKTVYHTWQLNPSDKTSWSAAEPLYGTGENNKQLTNAVRVEACSDKDGNIQVIAFTTDEKYYICYSTPGKWSGWEEIVQEKTSQA